MIAVDTNVLVRYAVKDDREQATLATAFLADNRCFVLKTVLIELAWVLSRPPDTTCPGRLFMNGCSTYSACRT